MSHRSSSVSRTLLGNMTELQHFMTTVLPAALTSLADRHSRDLEMELPFDSVHTVFPCLSSLRKFHLSPCVLVDGRCGSRPPLSHRWSRLCAPWLFCYAAAGLRLGKLGIVANLLGDKNIPEHAHHEIDGFSKMIRGRLMKCPPGTHSESIFSARSPIHLTLAWQRTHKCLRCNHRMQQRFI